MHIKKSLISQVILWVAGICVCMILVMAGVMSAWAKETSADVKRKQAATQKEIKQTKEKIVENEAEVDKQLKELGRINSDIIESKQKVETAASRVTALDNEIGSLERRIAAENEKLSKLRSEYLKTVKTMRVKRKQNSMLAFIFSASNFNQGMRRYRYMKQFSDWKDKQTNRIKESSSKLKKEQDELARTKEMHDKQLAAEQKAQSELQAQYSQQDAIIVTLKKNGETLKSHLARKQSEANSLNNQISNLIAEESRIAEAKRKEKAEKEAKAEAEKKAQAEAERMAREAEKVMEESAKKDSEQPSKATQNVTSKTDTPEKTAQSKEVSKKETPKKKTSKKETPTKDIPKKEPSKKENKGQEIKEESDVSYAEARRRKPKSDKEQSAGASKTSTNKETGSSSVSGTSFESMKGRLPRPVSGSFKVTSPFGSHSLPGMPDVIYDNPGIDVEVSSGAIAQAVFAGKVSGVYVVPGYSTVIIVNHGDYYTVYGNIAAANVKVGDNVKQGQNLGKLAAEEGDSSHSSIHFEVRHNRDKLDPMSWIK